MNTIADKTARISEIDISRQARALGILRWSDYALVVTCGMYALSMTLNLLVSAPDEEALVMVFQCVAIAILGFGAYTGWRHMGVIDPAVWRLYVWALPLVSLLVALLTLGAVQNLVVNEPDATSMQDAQLVAVVLVMAPIGLLALAAFVSVLVLRRMRIEPFGIRLATLLQSVAARSGERADSTYKLPRIDSRRGSAYAIAGGAILVGLLLARVSMTDETLQRISEEPLLRAVAKQESSIQLLAFFLIVRARRYFQVSADALRAVDKRPPILFLRSFTDDEKQRYFRAGSNRSVVDFSLETRLANHFHRFGPFVAIGSPKESVPQLGAARVLLPDDLWQERVLGWMRDAAVMVMYGGKTGWVNWELGQVLKSGGATRLILLIPEIKGWRRAKREQDLRERMQQIREVFRGSPWQEELSTGTHVVPAGFYNTVNVLGTASVQIGGDVEVIALNVQSADASVQVTGGRISTVSNYGAMQISDGLLSFNVFAYDRGTIDITGGAVATRGNLTGRNHSIINYRGGTTGTSAAPC